MAPALFGMVPAHALHIVLTNDDGFEASTTHALYQALKARGDSVIIASETEDNSGKGGAADFFAPIGPLRKDSRAGTVKAGAPGVGTLPGDADVFYVAGTPVAAALYGIDIAAPRKWAVRPDLVISGPNYGNNTGLVNNSSGTVNAALIAPLKPIERPRPRAAAITSKRTAAASGVAPGCVLPVEVLRKCAPPSMAISAASRMCSALAN
jgi:5'-nucleotidase